jgi:hypothetical protein
MPENLCTRSANQYELKYYAHNCVTPGISQGVCPTGPTDAHRQSQATMYGTITGTFAALPGKGRCIFVTDYGR